MKIILNIATTRNNPTPIATVNIKTILGTDGTCCARTVRSGSATVIAVPTNKLIKIISHILRDFVIADPTYSPIGIIAVSAPRVNSPIPRISITAPIMNESITPLLIGKNIKHRINTITVTGKTEESDSFSFSSSIVLLCLISSLFSLIIVHPYSIC